MRAELVEAYLAAWNEPDPGRRLPLLEQCWVPDGELFDPWEDQPLIGPARISDLITKLWRERIPAGAHFELASRIEERNGMVFRYRWELIGPASTPVREGVDTGRLAFDGRLALIITFLGPVPPP